VLLEIAPVSMLGKDDKLTKNGQEKSRKIIAHWSKSASTIEMSK
jgi:hypothetical protein